MNLSIEDRVKLRVLLIEFKVMLESQAKSTHLRYVAKRNSDKALEIQGLLDRI